MELKDTLPPPATADTEGTGEAAVAETGEDSGNQPTAPEVSADNDNQPEDEKAVEPSND